jgi:membrane fusion protein (multidrug efflux system)
MLVAPMDQLWVEANFKESQLLHIFIGQAVALIADVYARELARADSIINRIVQANQ